MSKNHQNSPPRLYFSGALSASLTKQKRKNLLSPRFPEQCRPLSNRNRLQYSVFRSIVGQSDKTEKKESPQSPFSGAMSAIVKSQ